MDIAGEAKLFDDRPSRSEPIRVAIVIQSERLMLISGGHIQSGVTVSRYSFMRR